MKKYVLALLGAALTGLAWAADAPPPAGPPAPAVVLPPAAPVECAAPCVHKVCVPEPTTVVKDKVIYDDRCVDYCLPKCSLLSILKGGCGCGAGGCADCGHPRSRRVLIKKVVQEECPDVKCVVQEQLP